MARFAMLVFFTALVQASSTRAQHEGFMRAGAQRAAVQDQQQYTLKVHAAGPQPMFTEETMPEVAPTLQCVISLTIQYFAIYTALAVVRTLAQFTGGGGEGGFFALLKILEMAATTVTYAPMLSVLFLGARMRAIQLSQGQTEKYKLPQPWVQQAMYLCTYAVLTQVILVLIMPVFTGETEVKCDKDGNLDTESMKVGGIMGTVISIVRYIVMAMLYGGFIVICYA